MKLLILVSAVAAVAARVVPEDDFTRIICETSDDSPYIHHIDQLIENLHDYDDSDTCFSDNLGYSDNKCGPTIKDFSGKNGGAVFSLCSGEITDRRPTWCAGDPPGKISCKDCNGWSREGIAKMIEAIRDECKNPHRAGGVYQLRSPDSEGRRAGQVRLYTMP